MDESFHPEAEYERYNDMPIPRLPTEVAAFLGHLEAFKLMHGSGVPIGNSLGCALSCPRGSGSGYYPPVTLDEQRTSDDPQLHVIRYISENCAVDWLEPEVIYGAVYNGYIEVVRICLDSKSILDVRADTWQTTLLLCAVSRGFSDIAELLIEYEANPSRSHAFGQSPFGIALDNLDSTMLKMLVARNPHWQEDAWTNIVHTYMPDHEPFSHNSKLLHRIHLVRGLGMNLALLGPTGATMLDVRREKVLNTAINTSDEKVIELLESMDGVEEASDPQLRLLYKSWREQRNTLNDDPEVQRQLPIVGPMDAESMKIFMRQWKAHEDDLGFRSYIPYMVSISDEELALQHNKWSDRTSHPDFRKLLYEQVIRRIDCFDNPRPPSDRDDWRKDIQDETYVRDFYAWYLRTKVATKVSNGQLFLSGFALTDVLEKLAIDTEDMEAYLDRNIMPPELKNMSFSGFSLEQTGNLDRSPGSVSESLANLDSELGSELVEKIEKKIVEFGAFFV